MAAELRTGDEGRLVETLQRQLIRENTNVLAGYGVDGIYGPETEQAVLTFQQKWNDIYDTGIADLPTQSRLIDVILYDFGAQGRGVEMLQEALMRFTIELPNYGADGDYGVETKEAVKEFQAQNGILANGIAGAVTFDTLDKALNTYYVEPGAHGTVYASVVRMVQAQLNDEGFNLLVDGVYGSQTEEAVRSFQEQKNLTIDGVAGPRTMNALDVEATVPMTYDEIHAAYTNMTGTTYSGSTAVEGNEKQIYINAVNNSSVFNETAPVDSPETDMCSVVSMPGKFSDAESMVAVHGHYKVSENKEFISYINPETMEIIAHFVIEAAGTKAIDKAILTAYDVDGTEVEKIDQTFMDYENQALRERIKLTRQVLASNSLSTEGIRTSERNFSTQALPSYPSLSDQLLCIVVMEAGCLALGGLAGLAAANYVLFVFAYNMCSAGASLYTSLIESCPTS